MTRAREQGPAGSRRARGKVGGPFLRSAAAAFQPRAFFVPRAGDQPAAVSARAVTLGHESEAAASPGHPRYAFARGARGARLWGRTPRTWRWQLQGQLGLGVWKAAARLQTFCFCKSRAGGSPLSTAVLLAFFLPRASERLEAALAASSQGRQGRSAGTLRSLTPATFRAQPGTLQASRIGVRDL